MAMIHVNRGATSLGAFSEEEVREGLRTGRFVPSDIGWREGMATWQPLSELPELSALEPAAPPSQTGATPISELVPPRSGLPWDERQTKGFFNAFVETLLMVLGKPTEAFTAMKREGGFGEPLLYVVVGSSFGIIVYVLMTLLLPSAIPLGDRHGVTHLVGAGIGSIFMIILAPALAAIGAFIGSAIFHVCLMIVGGARHSFETTFRVVCFVGGSVDPLLVIPFCGGLIVGIWKIVLYCIGLSRAHETDIGRAALAVFLPVIVCCGGGLLLAFMIGAFGAWSASHH
jgi:hypothetical protein